MFYLETTQDVFYLVGAICLVWLTVFLCVALFYAAKFFKQVGLIAEKLRLRWEKASLFTNWLKEKVVSEGVKIVSSIWANKNKKQK